MKKVLSILLALMLAFSPLNIAFAEELTEETQQQEQIQQEQSEEQSEESEPQAEEPQTELTEEPVEEQTEPIEEAEEEPQEPEAEQEEPQNEPIDEADPPQEPVQLYWVSYNEFYLKNGKHFAQNTTLDEIKSKIDNVEALSWNFATADGDNPRNSKGDVITPVLNWLNADYSEINSAEPTNGEPYMITGITVSLSDGDESENFILPDGKTEISFPIHIRNSAKAELYLDTPVDPTYYQISAYCPQDASGDFVLLYRYCGENMPTASQLDAAQDFATDSSFIDDYSDGYFGVWGLPDGEGWYAFYAQMGDYISD
ncbi:MAG: hypothetical protein J6C75_06285, partial [Oscillospiraceae bacterium]|nr:hypothetical protein [Oscillospiraceae bacterium]